MNVGGGLFAATQAVHCATPLMKIAFPPSATIDSKALFMNPFLIHDGRLMDRNLSGCPQLVWGHVCNGHVVSIRQHLVARLPILQLLHSFSPFSRDAPWVLEEVYECRIERGEHSTVFSMLWPVLSLCDHHHPLQSEQHQSMGVSLSI